MGLSEIFNGYDQIVNHVPIYYFILGVHHVSNCADENTNFPWRWRNDD
jgi:hypothetical protein